MPDETPVVQTRDLSWEELVRRAWGKEWSKPAVVYQWSNGASRTEPEDGGGVYADD